MRRFLLSLLGLLVATVLLVTWLASEERIQDALGEIAGRLATAALGRTVEIGWIAWEPLKGTFSAGDLAVLGEEGDLLVGADYVAATMRWGAIAPGVFDFREVTVLGLQTDIEIDASGTVHPFAELMEQPQNPRGNIPLPTWLRKLLPERSGTPLSFRVETLRIEDADLRFTMHTPEMEARARGVDAVLEFDDNRPTSFSLNVEHGFYRILDWAYDDIRIAGRGGVRDDGVFLRECDVQIGRPAIDARVNLDIPLAGDASAPLVAIDAEAQLDLQLVNQHYTPIPVFLGTADAGVDIAVWAERGIEMSGRLAADRLLMQGELVSDLAIDLFLDNDHIEFPAIRARLFPEGALAGTGTVNWNPDIALAFAVRTSNVADVWGRAFGGDLPLQPVGRQSGDTVFTMEFDPDWALHLRSGGLLDLDRFELLPASPASAATIDYRLQLEARPDQIRITAPRIAGGWFAATAEVTIAADEREDLFAAAGTAAVQELDRLGLDAVVPVDGRGMGVWFADAEAIRVFASAAPLVLWQSHWDRAEAALQVFGGGTLEINDIDARRGDGRVQGRLEDDGQALHTFLRLRTVDLGQVFDDDALSGIADGTADVYWPYRRLALPWLTGDLSLRELSWNDARLDDLTIRLRRSGRLYGGELVGRNTVLTVGGDLDVGLLTADGTVAVHLPANVAETLSVQTVLADAHLRSVGLDAFAYFLAHGNGSSDLGASGFWDGKRLLGWAVGVGERLRGRVALRAAERWSLGGEVSAHLAGRWLDSFVDPAGRLRVLASGRGRDRTQIEGVATLDQAQTALAGVQIRQQGDARAAISGGTLHFVEPMRLQIGQNGTVSFGGRLNEREADLWLNGQVPLDVVALEPVGIRTARGTLAADVQMRGAWPQPRLYGQGTISATRLALIDLDEQIENLTGGFTLDGQRLVFENVRGRVGDGTVGIRGEVVTFGPDLGQIQLAMRVASNAVRINNKLRTGIVGDVRLEGQIPNDLFLSGAIELMGLRYHDDLTWERLLLQVGGNRAPVPDRYQGIRLALDVQGTRDLRLQTGLLNGGMRMQLRLSGTTVRPVIDGVIDLERGNEFFFRGRIYKIVRGTIQFLGDEKNRPFLDIEAETEARYRGDQGEQTYRIRLLMFGPADQLDVRFESVPPLPEDDVLALLSLGILASDLRVDRVDGLELSSILLSQQISQIEREVQMLTGFDRIEIEPAYDNSRGTSSMQVTLEKRLNERLRLRLSTALDVNADQRVELGYSLLRGVDLSAGWDNRSGGTIGNFYVRPRFVVPLP